MYIAAVGREVSDGFYYTWLVAVCEAMVTRLGRAADRERGEAWVGNAYIHMHEYGYTKEDIEQQLALYADGVSDARLCDFMTVLPCS